MLKKTMFCSALICSKVFAEVSTEPTPPIVIINPTAHQYEPNSLSKSTDWLGLYCQNTTCKLKKTVVVIAPSTAEGVVGSEDVEVIQLADNPIAIFSQPSVLHEGSITTTYLQTKDSHSFDKLGYWHIPWGDNKLSIVKRLKKEGYGFSYSLQDKVKKQWLFNTELEGHYGNDTTPIIQWIGDMDGDNAVDLLINLGDIDCSFGQILFLSSLAQQNEFVHEAANFQGTEPACGC